MKKLILSSLLLSLNVNATTVPSSYTELLDYIVRAPYQGKTDNCLYMASTGAVEIAVNKHFGIKNPKINSQYDFNEKTAFNGKLLDKYESFADSWLEKPALKFNGGAVKNDDQPYSGRTFWKGGLASRYAINLPEVKTNWFLKSGNGSTEARFSYDEFRNADIEKIKEMLVKYRSPIVIVYRTAGQDSGYGYWNTWHAAVIVGFDDNLKLEEPCPLTQETIGYIGVNGRKALKAAVERDGGCKTHGGFYVRDSEDPISGESRVAPYVIKAYDDIKFLGTNAMVVYIGQ